MAGETFRPRPGAKNPSTGQASPCTLMRIAQVAPYPVRQNGIGIYGRLNEELGAQDPRCSVVAPANLIPRKSGPGSGDWRGREFPRHWSDSCLEAIDATASQLVHIQHGLYIGRGNDLARFSWPASAPAASPAC